MKPVASTAVPAPTVHARPLRRTLAGAVLATLFLLGACGSGDKPEVTSATLPPTTAAAEATTTSTTVDPNRHQVATSKAQGQQEIFEVPDGALKTTLPNPWLGTSPLTFLVKDVVDDDWLEVYLPVRPNGSTGFVRSADVDLSSHRYRIEVRLSEFNLKAFDGDEVLLDTQIAVAAENTPTPGGLYYTTELRGQFDPSNDYGTYAYGLSGYSEVLESFAGGPGQLGIHGTNQPELIGQQVSHGCIRMRNEDIEVLVPILPLAVPVEIIP